MTMIPTVMRMERISRFDKTPPEVLMNPFPNVQQFVVQNFVLD
jgi:hypothetical protein